MSWEEELGNETHYKHLEHGLEVAGLRHSSERPWGVQRKIAHHGPKSHIHGHFQ
jgi:hypothetical protein